MYTYDRKSDALVKIFICIVAAILKMTQTYEFWCKLLSAAETTIARSSAKLSRRYIYFILYWDQSTYDRSTYL